MSSHETDGGLDTHDVSRAIYGAISVLAVLLIMDDHPPTVGAAAINVFGTVLAVALAEAYSEVIGETIAHKKQFTLETAKKAWLSTRPVFVSASLPIFIILLSLTGLYSIHASFTISKVYIYVYLFVFGLRVGRLFDAQRSRVLLSGLFTLSIGILISLIKGGFH